METVELYEAKIKGEEKLLVFPNAYPQELTRAGTAKQIFVKGKGWTKPTRIRFLGVKIPNKWEKTTTWFNVGKLTHEYGRFVGEYLADGKTAGIVARQTAEGYALTYSIIKDLIPENFDKRFFECLKNNYMAACIGIYMFDICNTDKTLELLVPEYNSSATTYKGKPNVSMQMFVEEHFGEPYVRIIEELIKKT